MYSTTFAHKRLMRSKWLVRTKYACCAWATHCVRDSTTFRVATSFSSSDRPFRAIWDCSMTWQFNWRTSCARHSCDLWLSSGAFGGLLVSQLQTVVREQQENDTQNASCFLTNSPFKLPLRAKQTKDCLFSYSLIYRWWSNITAQYAQRWSSVSDDVVYL